LKHEFVRIMRQAADREVAFLVAIRMIIERLNVSSAEAPSTAFCFIGHYFIASSFHVKSCQKLVDAIHREIVTWSNECCFEQHRCIAFMLFFLASQAYSS